MIPGVPTMGVLFSSILSGPKGGMSDHCREITVLTQGTEGF